MEIFNNFIFVISSIVKIVAIISLLVVTSKDKNVSDNKIVRGTSVTGRINQIKQPNSYTNMIVTGDGDFLTNDTLWDFKVSKNPPKTKGTLQILIYYIMGKHSGNCIFDNITKVGIFNPRLNIIYVYDLSKIPSETIKCIEKEVIGY